MLNVVQGGLSPLRGPLATRKAEHSIDNIDAQRKHQATDAFTPVSLGLAVSVIAGVARKCFIERALQPLLGSTFSSARVR